MESPSPSALLPDEADLVVALRSRSPEAFEQVIARYGLQLMATTRRILHDQGEADDALQETLINAFRKIDRFEGRSPLGAWLNQIAVNACLMRPRVRRRRREEDIDELLPAFTDSGQFAEHQHPWGEAADVDVERTETAAQVRAAVAELPDKYRVPLVLRDLEGLEYEAIAAQMQLSENAVKIRVHRARQALRALLDPRLGTT